MTQFVPPANRGAPTRVPSAPWSPALAQQQQAPPRPIIRAQRDDDTIPATKLLQNAARPALLTIPSPEDIGVAVSRPAEGTAVDWTAVHNRLNRMGARCFHLERLSGGGCRITCLLPTAQEGRTRRIEAEAANESEAVRAALAKAEEWAMGR